MLTHSEIEVKRNTFWEDDEWYCMEEYYGDIIHFWLEHEGMYKGYWRYRRQTGPHLMQENMRSK